MEAAKSKMSTSKSKTPIKAPVKTQTKAQMNPETVVQAKKTAVAASAPSSAKIATKAANPIDVVVSQFGDVLVAANCNHCGADEKAKKREISVTAWQALVDWQEVSKETVDKAICQSCYNELREILIERADEIAAYAAAGTTTGQRKAG